MGGVPSLIFGDLIRSQPSFSSSSTSSPKSFRAALTGAGLDMSTPAIYSRLIGSVLEPPERNFL